MILLTPLDYFFIGLYILIVLYIGYRSKKGENEEGFLIANRNLGSLEGAATVVASNTGGGLLLTGVALTYVLGFSAMWFFVGAAIGYIIFGFFGAQVRKKSTEKKFYTLADYFFDKYGKVVGYSVAAMTLLIISAGITLQLVGGSKLLGSLTGLSFTLL
jgi:Na+/proline symporter